MSTIKVHGPMVGSTTLMCLLVAAEAGVNVEHAEVDMKNGAHKAPEYIKNVHPLGKVPALTEENANHEKTFRLFETRAICRYLDTLSGHKLIPFTTPHELAIFEQFTFFEATSVTPVIGKILMERLYAPMFGRAANDEAAIKAGEEVKPFLKVLNDQLASTNEYICGKFSLVDLAFFVFFRQVEMTAPEWKVFQEFPDLMAWYKRVSARPLTAKTVAAAK
jgi:glutathione S-transferase